MVDNKSLIVEYSKQSLENVKEIVSYLQHKFTEKEVNNGGAQIQNGSERLHFSVMYIAN
jgi:hypothetical protein